MNRFVHVDQPSSHAGVRRAEGAIARVRGLGLRLAAAWREGARRRAVARADAQFLSYAQFDPRVMAELQAAVSRAEAQGEVPAKVRRELAVLPSLARAQRRMQLAGYY